MPLDDLVSVIETLKQRIRDHGDSLRQNEYRTRMALIDPLLAALGWDVSDPGLVTAEYDVSGQKADYALLNTSANPAAFVEAKKLGESLVPHRMQMVNYANMSGVPYAGLTDGNVWEMYTVFDQKPLPDRLILEANISYEPAHRCALKFLLLWRLNLASGEPVAASEPLFSVDELPDQTSSFALSVPERVVSTNVPAASSSESTNGWENLVGFDARGASHVPHALRFPDNSQKLINRWREIPERVAEWAWEKGLLTPSNAQVLSGYRRYIVNTAPQHPSGDRFRTPMPVQGTPLFIEAHVSARASIVNAVKVLSHCGQDPGAVWLKVS